MTCPGECDCCSADGYCGTGKEFCYSSKGCQPQYGICRCGENYGKCQCSTEENGICEEESIEFCCSSKGYCGFTNEFCSLNKGCNESFGKCWNKDNTCNDIKERLNINEENESQFQCEENEEGLAKLM